MVSFDLAYGIEWKDNNETFLFASVSSRSFISTHFIAFYSRWDWTNRQICEKTEKSAFHRMPITIRDMFNAQCSVFNFWYNKYTFLWKKNNAEKIYHRHILNNKCWNFLICILIRCQFKYRDDFLHSFLMDSAFGIEYENILYTCNENRLKHDLSNIPKGVFSAKYTFDMIGCVKYWK